MPRIASWPVLVALVSFSVPAAAAVSSCPPEPLRVAKSVGGFVEYHGAVPGLPDLCREVRDGRAALFYYGVWRSDWPGAGDAYPAMHAVLNGAPGTRAEFVTRSVPGMQWNDSFVNEGVVSMEVAGRSHQALKFAHERVGIEGNTYHSVITLWRDVETGAILRVDERQIAGQSYGPDTTWVATGVASLKE